MKKLLLASAFLAMATPAIAGEYYVTAYGGGNWISDYHNDSKWISASTSGAGYVAGVAFGKKIDSVPGLRIELDGSFRKNGVDVQFCNTTFNGYAGDSTLALLVNAAYDIPVEVVGFQPYVLVGAGWGQRTGFVDSTGFERSSSELVWQAGAGVKTHLTSDIDLSIDYRHFDAPDLSVLPVTSEGSNDSVQIGLTFALN